MTPTLRSKPVLARCTDWRAGDRILRGDGLLSGRVSTGDREYLASFSDAWHLFPFEAMATASPWSSAAMQEVRAPASTEFHGPEGTAEETGR